MMLQPLVLATGLSGMKGIGAFLFIAHLVVLGLMFYLFFPVTWALKKLARGPLSGHPILLFIAANIGTAILFFTGFHGLGWVCRETTTRMMTESFYYWLGFLGGLGWLVYLFFSTLVNNRVATSPAWQFGIQELGLTVIGYGCGLAVGFSTFGRDLILILMIYYLIAAALALFTSADLMRRSRHVGSFKARAVVSLLVTALYILMLPLELPVWLMWRKALRSQPC